MSQHFATRAALSLVLSVCGGVGLRLGGETFGLGVWLGLALLLTVGIGAAWGTQPRLRSSVAVACLDAVVLFATTVQFGEGGSSDSGGLLNFIASVVYAGLMVLIVLLGFTCSRAVRNVLSVKQ